jgi:hypothetical protein
MRSSSEANARLIRLPLALIAIPMALLGAWGGIVPYAGPDFGYPLPAGTHPGAWQWTASHWQLYLVAGAATVAGALLLLAGRRPLTSLGGVLGLIGGSWFVLGPVFAPEFLTNFRFASGGASSWMSVLTPLGYNDGTGVLIAIFSGLALGLAARAPVAPPEDVEIYETPRERAEAEAAGTAVPQ